MATPLRLIPSIVTFLIVGAAASGPAPALAGIAPCDGGVLHLRQGSEVDFGWTGFAHDRSLVAGPAFGFGIKRRCADDSAPCLGDGDCEGSSCVATCDCAADTSCEITGPVGNLRCLLSLEPCATDNDCDQGDSCVALAAPPLPFSSAGVPTCAVAYFDTPVSGTLDTASGEASLSTGLKWRTMLGLAVEQPCPACGSVNEQPAVGQQFTCAGGTSDGDPCTVDAVSADFGGVSYDCAPSPGTNVSGPGRHLTLDELTTAATERTATLPCAFLGFRSNPLNAPDNPGKCLDDDAPCTSNADCRRCSGDAAVACSSNDDCSGNGSCAEAPDQPISCGFWCHCGYCGSDGALPCFDNSQCPDGLQCEAPAVFQSTAPNAPQQRPNDCTDDQFLCGEGAGETCATTTTDHCSELPWRICDPADDDCASVGGGTCVASPKRCFESRIGRTGSPSPLGSYCAQGGEACTGNADCTADAGDACVADVAAPRLAALFCNAPTASTAINATSGLTGPAALTWEALVEVCRCGEPTARCADFCDALSGCTPGLDCPVLCGDWNDDGELSASDASGVLNAAVGLGQCQLRVCDYNGSAAVTSVDALAVLRASVDLPSDPQCPVAAAAGRG